MPAHGARSDAGTQRRDAPRGLTEQSRNASALHRLADLWRSDTDLMACFGLVSLLALGMVVMLAVVNIF